MEQSTEMLQSAKVKLHLLFTQKVARSTGGDLLLNTLNEDGDVLKAHAERREAWTVLSKPLPTFVADVFDQA